MASSASGSADSSDPNPASDPMLLSQKLFLEARFRGDITEHSDASPKQGKVWKVENPAIGTGTYGKVRLERCKSNGNLRAVKQINTEQFSARRKKNLKNELEVITMFSKPEVCTSGQSFDMS